MTDFSEEEEEEYDCEHETYYMNYIGDCVKCIYGYEDECCDCGLLLGPLEHMDETCDECHHGNRHECVRCLIEQPCKNVSNKLSMIEACISEGHTDRLNNNDMYDGPSSTYLTVYQMAYRDNYTGAKSAY